MTPNEMHIVFLFGNGFDLQNHFKTGYVHFLKWLIRYRRRFPRALVKKTDASAELMDGVLDNIEKDEQKGFITWSNVERALGEKTSEEPFNRDSQTAIECKTFIVKTLYMYFLKESKNVCLSGKSRDNFLKSLLSFYESGCFNLSLQLENIMRNVRSLEEDRMCRIDILNFNYTVFIDRTIRLLKDETWKFFDGAAKIGKVLHVHGSIDKGDSIVLGVNDEGQLSNVKYQDDQDVKEEFVKPLLNQYVNAKRDNDVVETIKNGSVFCVFGMSVGETDRRWWNLIVDKLASTENSCAIFYSVRKDKEKQGHIIHYRRMWEKEFKENLYRVCEVDEETRQIIDPKIRVFFNDDKKFSMGLIRRVRRRKTRTSTSPVNKRV